MLALVLNTFKTNELLISDFILYNISSLSHGKKNSQLICYTGSMIHQVII